ncbi:MAG: hypothetical protein QOH62_1336 [Solirubrobacteraceae bacterium]|jgi:hypothetical protein|nr:hypothetical protein [Solirubrobacteraceae bacterium]
MKKLAIAVMGALALAAVGAGVSSAVDPTLGITASITPTKHGTKKKPKKVKLVVKLKTTAKDGDPPFAADTTVVHLAKELVFNGKALKSCTQAQVQADDTKCPKGSKVGQGTAAGVALGLVENLTVKAYNGPGGNKLELLVDGTAPLAIHSVIEGLLQTDSGAYGKKLVVAIPSNLQQPAPGAYATLTEFDTTINAVEGKKKAPYVGIASCKTKSMAFAADYHYVPDNTTKSVSTTAPCK